MKVKMMTTYKRIMAGILCLIISMSLVGCGNKRNAYDAEFIGVQW